MVASQDRQIELATALNRGMNYFGALVGQIVDMIVPNLEQLSKAPREYTKKTHMFECDTALGHLNCVAYVMIVDVPRRDVAVVVSFTESSASLGGSASILMAMLAVGFREFAVRCVKQVPKSAGQVGREFVVTIRL